MANYPNAVTSFATKNSGQTIQAADINDLQTEVTAIEAGLLQGTAPLNSSNSTVNNLSVLGNSTIAGNVTIGGSLTVSSGLTLVGGIALSGVQTNNSQPRARVYAGSTQALASGAEAAVTFDSEDYDPQTLHSTGTNPTRITPGSTGVWMFGATVNFAAETQNAYVRFIKNSTTAMGSAVGFIGNGANSMGYRIQAQAIEVIASTADWVEVRAFQNSGFSLQLGNASSRIDQNEFYCVKLF